MMQRDCGGDYHIFGKGRVHGCSGLQWQEAIREHYEIIVSALKDERMKTELITNVSQDT